jgi:hypothetical protein
MRTPNQATKSSTLHSRSHPCGHGWTHAKCTMNLDEVVGEIVRLHERSRKCAWGLGFRLRLWSHSYFCEPAQTHEASKKNTASLNDGTGTTYRTAFLHFQLQPCGANIPLTGTHRLSPRIRSTSSPLSRAARSRLPPNPPLRQLFSPDLQVSFIFKV